MTVRPRKAICLGCNKPRVIKRKGRCATCLAPHESAENARRRQVYDKDWRKISKRALDAHRAQYGDWCPVCNTATSDLTTDHVEARSLRRGVQVMCRSCNSSKGGKRR